MMLRTTNELYYSSLHATDGYIGECNDFIFDDENWAIRYIVARTKSWLLGQKILISPTAINQPKWDQENIPLRLGKKDVEKCPPLDADAPVSREYEKQYYLHFGYGMYWMGPDLWGTYPDPYGALHPVEDQSNVAEEIKSVETKNHLRSCKEIVKYDTHATDGDIGHIENFVFDDEQWKVQYLVLNTHNWLPGETKLVSVAHCSSIDWAEGKVYVNLTQEMIKNSRDFSIDNLTNTP